MKIKHLLNTEDKTFIYIHLIMAILMLLISSLILVFNVGNRSIIVFWCVVYLVITAIRHDIDPKHKLYKLRWVLPYLEFAAILNVIYIDISGIAVALAAIIAMDVMLDYKLTYAVSFGIVVYFVYMYPFMKAAIEMPLLNKVLIYVIAAFQFVLYNGFAYLTKKYSLQRDKLEKTTAQLHSKMIAMEQMTVLKERNRIAGEIHNTVGHQLTTALIQIEATQMVMEKDQDEAKRRLGIIKEQIRGGLGELRKSIQAINADKEYENLEEATKALLLQVKSHAGVNVDLEMDNVEELSLHIKKVIYHIILESITNGIKHGRCKKMLIKLKKKDEGLVLYSFNDGIVPSDLRYGYGLSQIKENIKGLEGSLVMKLNELGWFGLVAMFPIHYKEEDDRE